MPYSSRVYRQRNAHVHDDVKPQPFFSNQQEQAKAKTGGFFQAKLTVNKPGDHYEHEADALADQVVNRPSEKKATQQASSVQRLATSAEDEKQGTNDARMAADKEIQEKPEPDAEQIKEEQEENKKIQAKAEGNASHASAKVASKIESNTGKGNALPKAVLREMSSSFAADFSKVRIHDNGESAGMAKALHAQAFTHGHDIYFNAGKFDPGSNAGKFLLAHELTHVLQQKGGSMERHIQKEGEQNPATAVQPGGPFDMNDQTFTLNWKNGQWEGCGPVPGTAAGGENACVSSDSIEQIKNYFKKKPVPGNVDRPANCPPERWNFMFNYCCSQGKHIDPNQKSNCIPDKVQEPEMKIEKPEAPEKGDFEVPDGDTKMA
jgi:hypothetical protein